jgi:hypothetical protein
LIGSVASEYTQTKKKWRLKRKQDKGERAREGEVKESRRWRVER